MQGVHVEHGEYIPSNQERDQLLPRGGHASDVLCLLLWEIRTPFSKIIQKYAEINFGKRRYKTQSWEEQ